MTDERAYYCAVEVLNTRRLRGQPIPPWLKSYHEELEAEWTALSAHGPRTCQTANTPPTMDAEEAAKLMNCTPRNARRKAEKDPRLGRIVSGVWVFDRAAVENYARRRESA